MYFTFVDANASFVAFAPIDLKNADVIVKDGFANGAESPTVAVAESQGSTVIEITDGTLEKTVPLGAKLKFAGQATKYEVTARVLNVSGTDEVQSLSANTATGGTFDITFTMPPSATATVPSVTVSGIAFDAAASAVQTAVDAAFSGVVIDNITYTAGDITVGGGPANSSAVTFTFDGASVSKRNWPQTTVDGTNLTGGTAGTFSTTTGGEKPGSTDSITISPALQTALSGGEAITFSGIELVVKVGTGNFTYDETREIEFLKDRGKLDSVREGEEQPLSVSFSFTWEFLQAIAGGTPTVEDALKRRGPASTWTSTNPDKCAPYSVDVEIRNIPPCNSGSAEFDTPELIVLPTFYYTSLSHDASAALVSIEGECNAKEAIISRAQP